jgi:hypothetical protein
MSAQVRRGWGVCCVGGVLRSTRGEGGSGGEGGGLLLAAVRLHPRSLDSPGDVCSFVIVALLTSLSH